MSAKEKKGLKSKAQESGLLGSMRKCGALRKGQEKQEHRIQVGGHWRTRLEKWAAQSREHLSQDPGATREL